MKLAAVPLVFLAFAGMACGASGAGTGVDLSHFTGPAWSGSDTTRISCGGAPATQNNAFSVAIQGSGSSGLTYTSGAGCVFDFSVVGSTASLSNGPVVCSSVSGGTVTVLNWEHYTLSSSDGLHLTGTADGTATVGATTCVFTASISATR